MKTYQIEKEIKFCSAHRLLGHEGHCRYIHGHNYKAVIRIESCELDSVGRVIDFGNVKKLFKTWIDENWDHSFLVNKDDHETINALKLMKEQPMFYMDGNPTAENMAQTLLYTCQQLLANNVHDKIQITSVTIWETDDSCATCTTQYHSW